MGLPLLTRAADGTVVVLLALSAQVQIWTRDASAWENGPAVHAVLAAIFTVPLLARRRYPLLVLCAVVVASWLQYELGGGLGQPWLAFILALYAVAAHSLLRDAVLGAAVAMLITLVDGLSRLRDGEPWENVVPAWFVVAGVWGFGRWMRWRRRELDRLHEQTEVLERNQEEAARAAVAAERARIARELHDLVAHSMGVIVIQSQAAQRVMLTDPAAAEQALMSIEVTGRQGLAEMRRLLDVLIDSEDAVDSAPLAPQPALRHLGALLDRVRLAGLAVDVSVEGEERPLPPGVDLSAYRIVQEALTNTLRHAGAARVQVHVRYCQDAVEVEVADDGTTPNTDSAGGHGLIGMSERVALYGGSLHAGHRPEGGYLVQAHLPVDAANTTPI
ncbi:histidine kinase [Nocardioides sp.]|uniref:sensor histidine kinase n=1 Tax=Nocardioides sp. TaxID=35761 RepID=UPI00286E94F2|nr:histidine kinase [Nocardioides sp.]